MRIINKLWNIVQKKKLMIAGFTLNDSSQELFGCCEFEGGFYITETAVYVYYIILYHRNIRFDVSWEGKK